MSKQYALIKNEKVKNIVVADESFINTLINEESIDFAVELNEENFYNQINKAEIGSYYYNNEFIPKSWLKQDNVYVAPVEKPNDEHIYEWNESFTSWIKLNPYPSWSWDSINRISSPPIPMPELPEDGSYKYEWNESTGSWDISENPS